MKLFKNKKNKTKKIKNEILFKRGSFSLAITALVIAGIIVFNVLVGALSERFVLEFDMSSDKVNSISAENKEYIKGIDKEIKITVCADKDDYVSQYGMANYAQQYGVSGGTEYYNQTVKLLDRYADYNDKIKLEYKDVHSSDFSSVISKYSDENLSYGDIIVSAEVDGKERYRIVTFEDIYSTSEASYYEAASIQGNKVETAVTSAIAYVTSEKEKNAVILKGHSKTDYTERFQTLLKDNNYQVDVLDGVINEIDDKYDIAVICAPNTDFLGDEIQALSEFLDNGGKLNKGLIFFADATASKLTNLYDFLKQWGINVEDGILFETNSDYHIPSDPMNLFSQLSAEDEAFENIRYGLSSQNAVLSRDFETKGSISVTELITTFDSVVEAPVGTKTNWNGYGKLEKKSYPTVIESVKNDYDDDNNAIDSYVYAFASVDFIESQYLEESIVSNKDITLKIAERICKADKNGITFDSKSITGESFSSEVTETKSKTVRAIFMFVIPALCVVAGVFVYIKRRNAE